MSIEIQSFRISKKDWIAVSLRRSLLRMVLSFSLLGLGAGLLAGTNGGALGMDVLLAVGVFIGASLAFYVRTVSAMGRQGELPWELQNVVLEEEAYHTTYESGFMAHVPWTKFRRLRRFPQGLFLETEGSGGAFLPSAALTPEAEAFISARVGR